MVGGILLEVELATLPRRARESGLPVVLIAHTVFGKGVSFMENNPKFHGAAPNADEMKLALQELQ